LLKALAGGDAMDGLSGGTAELTVGTERDTFFESIRRGERHAVERAYREHRKDVERSIRNGLRRAGRLTPANVSDVVQEVFAKAFSERARARYDGTRAFGPYLQRIAGNVLIDWVRHARRQITSDVDLEGVECGDERAWGPCDMFPQELLDATRLYVGTLSSDLRSVHELRFVAGAGQLDAARSLGISRQRLRTLERRLVDGLRRELRGDVTPGDPSTR
jgi:RNA polymerase sigma factor (sigma-70 family)